MKRPVEEDLTMSSVKKQRKNKVLRQLKKNGFCGFRMLLKTIGEIDWSFLPIEQLNDYIAERCNFEHFSHVEVDLMFEAVASKNRSFLDYLLKNKSHVSDDALLYATEHGYTDVTHHLLNHGGNIKALSDDEDEENKSVLHFWAQLEEDNYDMFDLLVGRGADLEARDSERETPLFHVIGKIGKLKKLLLAGAEPNCKDSAGETPLQKAIRIGSIESQIFLLLYGADESSCEDDIKRSTYKRVEIMRSIHCDLHQLDEVAYILSGGGGVDSFISEYVENVDDCVSVFEEVICRLLYKK
jgi:hypothetical protein